MDNKTTMDHVVSSSNASNAASSVSSSGSPSSLSSSSSSATPNGGVSPIPPLVFLHGGPTAEASVSISQQALGPKDNNGNAKSFL